MILGVLLWRLNSQISIYAYSVSGWISTAFSLFTRMLAGFKRGTNNRFLLWLDKLERPIFFSYHGMAVQLAIAMHEWEREAISSPCHSSSKGETSESYPLCLFSLHLHVIDLIVGFKTNRYNCVRLISLKVFFF